MQKDHEIYVCTWKVVSKTSFVICTKLSGGGGLYKYLIVNSIIYNINLKIFDFPFTLRYGSCMCIDLGKKSYECMVGDERNGHYKC